MSSTPKKISACAQALMDNIGISRRDAQDMVDLVWDRRAAWAKQMGEQDLADRLTEMALKDLDAAKRKSLNNKRARVLGVMKQREVAGTIDGFVKSGMSLKQAWHTFLLGGSDWVEGSLNSVAQTRLGLERLFTGDLAVWARKNPAVLKALKSNKQGPGLELKLADALINKKYEGGPINELAKLMSEKLEAFRVAANDAGLDIGVMKEGYLPHRHDRQKMLAAGFDAFHKKVLKTADLERTYGTASPTVDQIKGTWEAILGNQTDFMDGAALISPRKAAGLEKHREIHFKDAQGWTDYATDFGRSGVWDAVTNYLETGVRQLAVIQRLGPRPEDTIARIIDSMEVTDQATEKFKSANSSYNFRKRDGEVANYYRVASGEDLAPDNYSLAKVASTIRSIESMAKLGGATLSALADLPVAAMRLRTNHGLNMVEAWGETFNNFVSRIPEDQRAEFGYVLDAICEGIQGDMAQRFDLENPLGAGMAKGMRLFFKFNGLTPWTDAMKKGMYMGVAGNIGFHSKKNFDDLPLELRETLKMYGFDETKWDVVRSQAVRKIGDKEYLCPELVRQMDDDLVDRLTEPQWGNVPVHPSRQSYATLVGDNSGRAFQFLPFEVKQLLQKHGLEDRWDFIRTDLLDSDADGLKFIDPKQARSIPDESIHEFVQAQAEKNGGASAEKINPADFRAKLEADLDKAFSSGRPDDGQDLLKESLRRQYKQKLEADLAGFLSSEVNKAVLTPDERNRHALLRGTRPGTWTGELVRSIAQFKSFPVLFVQQVLMPMLASRKVKDIGWGGALSSTALLMAQATVFGGLAMEAKRLARGEKPYIFSEDPDWLAAFGAAFTQGGGAGIYGDFLLGEYNRFGQSALESLAGPTLGSVGEVLKLFAKTRTSATSLVGLSDETGLTAADVLRFGKSITPGLNVWYSKLALDAMFLWDLDEFASPGTQARRVKRARKEGREYWLDPSKDRLRLFTD